MSRHYQTVFSSQFLLILLVGLLLSIALAARDAEGQALQRLFSTPAERAELDRRRYQQLSGVPVRETVLDIPLPITVPSDEDIPDVIFAHNGTVQREQGRYTVWLNNQPFDQDNLPANVVLLEPYQQGRLRITDTGSGRSFQLKPGQVLNLTQGLLMESYNYEEQASVGAVSNDADDSLADSPSSNQAGNAIDPADDFVVQ